MVRTDITIGFENKPNGLEDFLEHQGYSLEPNLSDARSQSYAHDEMGSPTLDYYPEFNQESDEVPDWKGEGYNLSSLLNISFPVSEFDAVDEGNRIAKEVTNRFEGIYYDYNLKDFFRASQL